MKNFPSVISRKRSAQGRQSEAQRLLVPPLKLSRVVCYMKMKMLRFISSFHRCSLLFSSAWVEHEQRKKQNFLVLKARKMELWKVYALIANENLKNFIFSCYSSDFLESTSCLRLASVWACADISKASSFENENFSRGTCARRAIPFSHIRPASNRLPNRTHGNRIKARFYSPRRVWFSQLEITGSVLMLP